MEINLEKKDALAELNCFKIDLNQKPDLILQAVNNQQTLVIVVDMIDGFTKKGAMASPRCGAIVKPTAEFLERLNKAQRVFIRDCHSEGASEFKWFPKHCTAPDEVKMSAPLNEFDHIDIPKNSTNGFFSLIKKIPDFGFYTNIIITGVCTDICVMQLALTLKAYINETNSLANVVVLTDLVETYSSEIHNADLYNMFALKLMENAGIQLFKNVI